MWNETVALSELASLVTEDMDKSRLEELAKTLSDRTRIDADAGMAGTELSQRLFTQSVASTGQSAVFGNSYSDMYRTWQAERAVGSVVETNNKPITAKYMCPQRHKTRNALRNAPLHTPCEFIWNVRPNPKEAKAEARIAPQYVNGWSVSTLNQFLYSDEEASALTLDEVMALIGTPLGVVTGVEDDLVPTFEYSRSTVAISKRVLMFDYWRFHAGDPTLKTTMAPNMRMDLWWVVSKEPVVVTLRRDDTKGSKPSPPPPPPPPPQQRPPKPQAMDAKHGLAGPAQQMPGAAAAAAVDSTGLETDDLAAKREYIAERFLQFRALKRAAALAAADARAAATATAYVYRISPHLTVDGRSPAINSLVKEYAQIHVGTVVQHTVATTELSEQQHDAVVFPRRFDWYENLIRLPLIAVNLSVDSTRPRFFSFD